MSNRSKWDEGKVPDDFPRMKAQGFLGSQGGKPYMPYYSAKEVWAWMVFHSVICFNCETPVRLNKGKWIKGDTTIPIFTCYKCIETHGEEDIKLGYDKM